MRFLSIFIAVLLAIPAGADTYIRQPAIDAVHYEIELELSDLADVISGTARVHVMMQQDGVSNTWLDFVDMTVDKLSAGGTSRPPTYREGRLAFDFDMPLEVAIRSGEQRQVRAFRISAETETFRFPLQTRPTAIEIDPDNWVLKSVSVSPQ